MDCVYVLLFIAVPFLCMFIGSQLIKRVRSGWLSALIVFGAMGVGILIGYNWPLRQARVLMDIEFFQEKPIRVVSSSSEIPGPFVELVLLNGKNKTQTHTIERKTRQITFSKVPLPDDVQF